MFKKLNDYLDETGWRSVLDSFFRAVLTLLFSLGVLSAKLVLWTYRKIAHGLDKIPSKKDDTVVEADCTTVDKETESASGNR